MLFPVGKSLHSLWLIPQDRGLFQFFLEALEIEAFGSQKIFIFSFRKRLNSPHKLNKMNIRVAHQKGGMREC